MARVDRCSAVLVSCALALGCGGSVPARCALAGRTRMHAHNDYNHARPLLDALAEGASSVEADVFLQDGVLLVGHDRSQLTAARSLEALYLRPLYALWEKQGAVLPGGCARSLWLLIDFKAEPEASYHALAVLLHRYRGMLTSAQRAGVRDGAVRVVITGERPKQLLAGEPEWLAGYDGRVLEHDTSAPMAMMPLVSEQWGRLFEWTGVGTMPAAERARLVAIVAQMHAEGRAVRFWATPDEPSVWRELLTARVDYINTDDLPGLRQFLRQQAAAAPLP